MGFFGGSWLYSTWKSRFRTFFPHFPSRVRVLYPEGSIFEVRPIASKPISDCSPRWVRLIGANILWIRFFPRKLRLKVLQKRPKNEVFDRKVGCSHLCLSYTSQFFNIIISEFCSFDLYIKTRNLKTPSWRKNAPKSGRGTSSFWNFEFGPTSYTSFDAPWKTEQLMWRHLCEISTLKEVIPEKTAFWYILRKHFPYFL